MSAHEDLKPHPITIGKIVVPRQNEGEAVVAEIFTMTIGGETIQLLPHKNWSQLDTFKWRARGILPRTPAGLEITFDHLKIAGETVSPWDPNACAKLEQAFNEWLAFEEKNLDEAKEKAQAPILQPPPQQPDEAPPRFEVDASAPGQPRLKCMEGQETAKVVALNLQGLNALIQDGLMRKPQTLKVGALHNWVELDGQLFRFEGHDWAKALEQVLNEKYSVAADPDVSQDVVVSANPASPTGFDIQFAAAPNGLVENRKRHLNEETVHLLQDPARCRVLRKGLTARLAAPELVFKLNTPGGGECYLEPGPDTLVSAVRDDGQPSMIDLSQPVNLLKLGAQELTAVFNHPAINRRARLAQARLAAA